MNKSYFFILSILGMLFFNINFSLAAEEKEIVPSTETENQVQQLLEEKYQVVKPGVLPNSFWYWADVFAEELQYVFEVGKESKGDFLIDNAAERLAEMKALSEAGINKYAERLTTQHEVSINKAKVLLEVVREQGLIKLQEEQANLEKNILLTEYDLKKQAKNVPAQYEQVTGGTISKVGVWFKTVLSHLSSKKQDIDMQRAKLTE